MPTTTTVISGSNSFRPWSSASPKRSVVLATVETIETASSENPPVTSRPRVFNRA